MTKQKDDTGLDFGALRLGIERCDPDIMLDFYAEDARLSIVNAGASQASPFELYGKPEIAKHLRATFGQKCLHRVEGEDFVGDQRVTFWEACEYPDGSRVSVETMLEVNDGKIVRQVDVVAKDTQGIAKTRSPKVTRRREPAGDQPAVDELLSNDLSRCSGHREKPTLAEARFRKEDQ